MAKKGGAEAIDTVPLPEDKVTFATQAALVQAVSAELALELPPTNPSDCEVRCYSKFPPGPARNECLDNCKGEAAAALVAAKLRMELFVSFVDIIWGGGDIDPLPLERAVRARFSEGPKGRKG
ncbi:MAG: hypothetical protein V3U52_07525 [Thermoplasmata archaeon]